MQQPFQYPLQFSQLSQSSGMQLSGMTLSQDLPTMFAPVPAKRLRCDDNGGRQQQQQQQQQQYQQQLPGMQQQPFPYPLQFSGMQQQLLTQFAAAANAPYMQYASGSTNINSTGSASSKSSKKKKKGGKTGRRRGPPRGKYVDPRVSTCSAYIHTCICIDWHIYIYIYIYIIYTN